MTNRIISCNTLFLTVYKILIDFDNSGLLLYPAYSFGSHFVLNAYTSHYLVKW